MLISCSIFYIIIFSTLLVGCDSELYLIDNPVLNTAFNELNKKRLKK